MRVFVTGAAGYIGGRMAAALSKKDGVEALVGTDIRQPEKQIDGCRFYPCDIRDDMSEIFEKDLECLRRFLQGILGKFAEPAIQKPFIIRFDITLVFSNDIFDSRLLHRLECVRGER